MPFYYRSVLSIVAIPVADPFPLGHRNHPVPLWPSLRIVLRYSILLEKESRRPIADPSVAMKRALCGGKRKLQNSNSRPSSVGSRGRSSQTAKWLFPPFYTGD